VSARAAFGRPGEAHLVRLLPMATLLTLINRKSKAHINIDEEHRNPYAVALKYPEESETLFDCDLKLLLMDGLSLVCSPAFFEADAKGPISKCFVQFMGTQEICVLEGSNCFLQP
jgi:hypothetical protein